MTRVATLPSSTALAALPALALDLETTGLNVSVDRVVQVAALAMTGPRILPEPRLDSLVNPRIPIRAEATGIHGIDAAAVACAPSFTDIAGALRALIDGCAVIGHNIAFDLAVLRHEAARANLAWHDPPALDVALLLGALEPSLGDLSLEALARRLDVPVTGRHSALGDATAAAAIFGRLLARLREIDVRTLGEAQSFAARRHDLLERQASAGWNARPGIRAPRQRVEVPPRIDSYIFERRVDEVMSVPPARIAADATVQEASQAMTERRLGALLVGNSGPPDGIITERDVLGAIARQAEMAALQVREIMSSPVQSIAAGELLYRALGRMDSAGFRHLCVVDDSGSPIGMLSQRDLLRHRARAALSLGDEIAAAEDALALATAFGKLPLVAERLVAEGVPASQVARVVASEVRALTARAARLAAEQLAARGRPAPAAWCVFVLGSAGRGESLLSFDQDNGLIHSGERSDDAWFGELGAALAGLLDEAGLARCRGGVMAANAVWRGTREDWRERVQGWLRRASSQDLLNVDIFFDLMPVAGDLALARDLHAESVDAAARSPSFLAILAQAVATMPPSLGPFGGLRTTAGRIDLKLGALLPLVGLARTLALRIGSLERSTPERVLAAAAAGRIVENDARVLIDVHAHLLELVLRQQLVDLAEGVRPSTRVSVRRLGRAQTRDLARELRRLEEMLEGLQRTISGA